MLRSAQGLQTEEHVHDGRFAMEGYTVVEVKGEGKSAGSKQV